MSLNLNPRAPEPPNFYMCNEFYGQGIATSDCMEALCLFLEQQPLLEGNEHHQVVGTGTCGISVSSFVPDIGMVHGVSVVPALDLAAWIIKQCVSPTGFGGWGTIGFENMVDYLTDPDVPSVVHAAVQIPSQASFMSVMVQKMSPNLALLDLDPSSFDPGIAEALADAFWNALNNLGEESALSEHYSDSATLMEEQAHRMQRGGYLPWYQLNSTTHLSSQMAYSCDVNLGSPAPVDCNRLQYSQLGPAGDTMTIGPGATKVLASRSCKVVISASINIVITWAQVQAALSTLINACVMHPLQSARGGKAYYQIQRPSTLTARNTITGLNALPPHLNVTLSG
ncbi:hypothetical protein MMC14_004632 [Varicellaria rhodocarpa]|nr:hypothetical protein [Varicellaria rhodocarpa]